MDWMKGENENMELFAIYCVVPCNKIREEARSDTQLGVAYTEPTRNVH